MKKLFPIFLQSNYPKFNAAISDEDRDSLFKGFSEYLNKLPVDAQKRIKPTSLADVISNVDNPLRQNGWHPALILHFKQYIEAIIPDNVS